MTKLFKNIERELGDRPVSRLAASGGAILATIAAFVMISKGMIVEGLLCGILAALYGITREIIDLKR